MASEALNAIRKIAGDFRAEIGITLGSGQAGIVEHIEDKICIPYDQIPGIPVATVSGHKSQLILGRWHGIPVACLQGRLHRYEGASYEQMKILIRCLKELGCHTVVMTNASGSLRDTVGPGSIVLINDHINFQPGNPLAGPNDAAYGPRFLGMENTYCPQLREQFHTAAKTLGIHTHEGVYMSVLGPSFETPAEIRAFRTLGADVIGMSTVPEVIIARHCGLSVAVVALITNFAAGMTCNVLSHEETLFHANAHADTLQSLLEAFMQARAAAQVTHTLS